MANIRRPPDDWDTWAALSRVATPASLGGPPERTTPRDADPTREPTCCISPDLSCGITPSGMAATAGNAVLAGSYASRAAPGTVGAVYLPTDGAEIDRDNGATWDKWGPIYPMVRAPTAANWTWVNQGTATATDSATGLYLSDATTHNGNSFAILKRSLPANKTVIAHLSMVIGPGGTPTAGLIWRQSGGANAGRLVAPCLYATSTAFLCLSQQMTSPNAWSANYFQYAYVTPMNWWVKLVVTANTRETHFSPDGKNWVLVHSIGNTDWVTADEVGIYVDAYNAPVGLLVDSWSES